MDYYFKKKYKFSYDVKTAHNDGYTLGDFQNQSTELAHLWINNAANSDKNGLMDEILCSELLAKSWSSNVLLTDDLCSKLLSKSKESSNTTTYVKGIITKEDSESIKLDEKKIENIIEIKKKIQDITGGDDLIENKNSYHQKSIKIKKENIKIK